jgi:hypothetical protein
MGNIGNSYMIAFVVFCAVIIFGCLAYSIVTLPPDEISREAHKNKANHLARERILVPVVDGFPDIDQLKLACQLGYDMGAEIILGYVQEDPTALLPQTSSPATDLFARLELARLTHMVASSDVPVRSRLVYARSLADGILHLAELERASTIILSIGEKEWPWSGPIGEMNTIVTRRSNCRVVLVKPPVVSTDTPQDAVRSERRNIAGT